jgi:hypothetical protein
MSTDRYPTELLLPRLFDLFIFAAAIAAEFYAAYLLLLPAEHKSADPGSLSALATALAVYISFRDVTVYQQSHFDQSLQSGALAFRFGNVLARLRARAAHAAPVVIAFAIFLSVVAALR